MTLKTGSRGPAVQRMQMLLNTHLKPQNRIAVDGFFGPATEMAVRRFQEFAGVAVDGLVGAKTLRALSSAAVPRLQKLQKFSQQLGLHSDFVQYVRKLEQQCKDRARLIAELSDFSGTGTGARYFVTTVSPGIVDMRHFFAAFTEVDSGTRTDGRSGTVGVTLLLGVGNEVGQCVNEAAQLKLNSCFSAEDLGSNRLGAQFGKEVRIVASQSPKPQPLSQTLATFLQRRAPQPSLGQRRSTPPLPGVSGQLWEALGALGHVVDGLLFPKAY